MIAEYNGAGALQRKYVYGPGIDEPIRFTQHSTLPPQPFYFHADGLGSVTEITGGTGQLVESYRYDVYGAPTILDPSTLNPRLSSAIGNRLLFTARDRDPDTTWYNYRYRYYNPTLGRFVQPDPIGLAGGDVNLYRYVGDRVIIYTDAFGLKKGFWNRLWNRVDRLLWDLAELLYDNLHFGLDGDLAFLAAKAAQDEALVALPPERNPIANDAFRHCLWSCLLTKQRGGSRCRGSN